MFIMYFLYKELTYVSCCYVIMSPEILIEIGTGMSPRNIMWISYKGLYPVELKHLCWDTFIYSTFMVTFLKISV
jgi:hypothetical protein